MKNNHIDTSFGQGVNARFAAAARFPRKGKLSVMQLVRTALACRFLRVKTRVNLSIFQIFNPHHFIAARKLVSICIIFKSKKKCVTKCALKLAENFRAHPSMHASTPCTPACPPARRLSKNLHKTDKTSATNGNFR